jgi:hypothetical protein
MNELRITVDECPTRVNLSSPVSQFHNLRVVSLDPETIIDSS